jgi:hypothetical protein
MAMRDNSKGYPELLDAYQRDGSYYGAVRVVIAGEAVAFEFGVEERGYHSLKRVLQSHPFGPGGKYKYFFRGSFHRRNSASDIVTYSVRVEQGTNGKGYDFDGTPALVSNLLWFQSLRDIQPASALKRLHWSE